MKKVPGMAELLSPTIIVGMHRSGTTLVTTVLRDIGWFPGRYLEHNAEAWFHYLLNRWAIRKGLGRWDDPEPFLRSLDQPDVRARMSRMFRRTTSSPAIAAYLGASQYVRHRVPGSAGVPWGWKDPRNTFTLPLWLDLYPNARVLHVIRNGVDVAQSLVVRHQREQEKFALAEQQGDLRHRIGKKLGRYTAISNVAGLDGALDLWCSYVERGQALRQLVGDDRYCEVRYESLLEDPTEGFARLATFVGVAPQPAELSAATAGIDQSRGNAWTDDAELSRWALSRNDLLSRWGYGLDA